MVRYGSIASAALFAIYLPSAAVAQTTPPPVQPAPQVGAAPSPVRPDSFLFFTDKDSKDFRTEMSRRRREFGPTAPSFHFQIDEKLSGDMTPIYQREIGRWKDPFTLPHTRTECVQWASGDIPFDGKWKTCSGWKTQTQWLFVTAFIRVQTKNPADIGGEVDACFRDAVVAGALAAIFTGGTAGLSTFEGILKGCLISKLPDLVNVTAFETTEWGDWE